MMRELTVNEATTCLSESLVEVEKGEQFVITRRGVPVARLMSATPAAARLDIPLREAIEQGRDRTCR